jgi:hypothetical protein
MTLRLSDNPPYKNARPHRDREEGKTRRSCSSFSQISRGLFAKNSSWQAKQSIPHTDLMFHSYCMKMWEDFALDFGVRRAGCCITTTHRLTLPLSVGNFWTKTTWLSSLTLPTFLFLLIEDKTERLPFWHNWGDGGRITGGAEQPHRTRLLGCV